jgi:MoaA/NifB/PqqE/SkfB family radical SAM enzyme
LADLGLQHIVFSGGEPLLRKDFPDICEIFKKTGARETLLTNGVLLRKRYQSIKSHIDEIIVSLDGGNAHTHDGIRGVASFDTILEGVQLALTSIPKPNISFRTVIQKKNFQEIGEIIELGKFMGIQHVSFLAADVLSDSFGRERLGNVVSPKEITLTDNEVAQFRSKLLELDKKYYREFESGFIMESPKKLMHIADYFEAINGTRPFPRNSCNAPMVSAVITATGELQPCFFLPSFGDIRKESVSGAINKPETIATRKSVRNYILERCQTCVCCRETSAVGALLDKF